MTLTFPTAPQTIPQAPGVSPPFTAPSVNRIHSPGTNRHGINLGWHSFWTTDWMFTDASKKRKNVSVAGEGFYVFYDIGGHYPDPTGHAWIVLLDHSSGTLSSVGDGSLSGFTSNAACDSYTLTIATRSALGIILKIASGAPTNIRLIPVDYAGTPPTYADGTYLTTNVFHPTYVSYLAPFKGPLRCMEITKTNDSPLVDWADRTPMATVPQTDDNKGVAYEWCIDLANKLGTDLWITIPHKATDDFITQLCTLIHGRLTAGKICHLEWSNETWNGKFGQAQYCYQKGIQYNFGTGPNGGLWYQAMRYSGFRAAQAFKLARAVSATRFRCILNFQTSNSSPLYGPAADTLAFVPNVETITGTIASYADAIAIAPYADLPDFDDPQIPSWTLNQLHAAVLARMQDVLSWMDNYRQIADEHIGFSGNPLGLVMYEWGPGLIVPSSGPNANNGQMKTLFDQYNLSTLVADEINMILNKWMDVSGDSACYFQGPAKHDKGVYFGLTQYVDQVLTSLTDSPKYKTLADFVLAHQVP